MLKPITPGLHRIHNGSKQTAKVQISVAPYDELEVSDDVAAQLPSAFKDGPAPPWPDEWNPPAAEPVKAEKAPARKRAAKKAK